MIRFLTLFVLVTVFFTCVGKALDKEAFDADTTDFVTASILHIGPGEHIYSSCGHAALRMQCPMHNLDLCFSYLVPDQPMLVAHTVFGAAKQGLARIPTMEYLAEIDSEGREVHEYELNLTEAEKRRLWQILDEESERGAYLDYDYINHGCALGLLDKINESLIGDQLNIDYTPSNLLNCRTLVSRHLASRPWDAFWMSFMLGEKLNYKRDGQCLVMIPHDFIKVLSENVFDSSEGEPRPILLSCRELAAQSAKYGSIFSPLLIAVLLLCLGIAIGALKHYVVMNKFVKMAATAYDILMVTLITALGILMALIIFVSDLYGTEWNWQILVYNILPLCGFILRHRLSAVANYILLVYIIGVISYLFITLNYVTEQAELFLPNWIMAITAVIWLSSLIKIINQKTS